MRFHPAAALLACVVTATCARAADEDSFDDDAARFRFGVDAAGGGLSVTGGSSGPMFGVDVRLGFQFSDVFSVYAQPHLAAGIATPRTGENSLVGTLVTTLMAEAAAPGRLFAAAGAGFGELLAPNSPGLGLAVEGRVGGYPWLWKGRHGADTRAVTLGADVRGIFAGDKTALLVTAFVGYEAF